MTDTLAFTAADERASYRALGDLITALSEAESESDIHRAVARGLPRIVACDRASVALLRADGQSLEVFALEGDAGAIPLGGQLPLEGSSAGEAVRLRAAWIRRSERGSRLIDSDRLAAAGIRWFINAALLAGDTVIGSLNCGRKTDAGFSDDELDLVGQVARIVSANVQHRRLLEASRAAAERERMHARRLDVINRIGQALSSENDEERVFQTVARGIAEVFPADRVSYAVLEPGHGAFRVIGLRGDGAIPAGTLIPARGTVLDEVQRTGRPMAFPDLRKGVWPEHRRLVEAGLISAASVPVQVHGVVLGVLNMASRTPLDFAGGTLAVISALGRFMAATLGRIRARRELEKLASAIIDALPAQVAVIDGAGRIAAVNREWQRFAAERGADPAGVIGADYAAICERSDAPEARAMANAIHAALHATDPNADMAVEYACRHQAGVVWFLSLVRPFAAAGSRYALVAHIDVSELKTAQAKVEQLNDSLERRVRQRTSELETANRQLEAFSYSVAHDLRAPLRHVHAYAHILLKEHSQAMAAEGRAVLARLLAIAPRMDLLIDGLLRLARVSRAQLAVTNVDLAGIAREIVGELATEESQRRAQWRIPSHLPARGDTALLRSLLTNLLSNAWKFTRHVAEAVIEVGVLHDNGTRRYFVRDNGAGFPMEYAEKLFLPFERLHGETEFEGSGIGLATVAWIVRRHGGEVRADGQPGRGATFWFSLGTDSPSLKSSI